MLGSLLHQHRHFLLADFDAIGLADFREQQAETNATNRDIAIFVLLVFHFLARGFGIFFLRGFLLELLPDLAEFRFDHARRHFKIVAGGELVEQLALHMGTGQAVQLLFDLPLEQFGQLVDTFETHGLGHFVVGLGDLGFLYFADDHVEGCIFALQVVDIIVVREGDLDEDFVIGFLADQLILEARDQATRTEFDRHALALATVERHAVDLAFEIDQDLVAGLGLVGFRCGFKLLLALGEFLQRLVDRFLVRFDLQPFQLQPLNIGGRDFRQDFQLHFQLDVLARLGVNFLAVLRLNRRLHRGTQLVVFDRLLNAFLDAGIDRILQNGIAVHLANKIRGNLAFAEAGHIDLRGNFLDLGVDTRFDILRGDLDFIGPFQTFVQRFNNLHDYPLVSSHSVFFDGYCD